MARQFNFLLFYNTHLSPSSKTVLRRGVANVGFLAVVDLIYIRNLSEQRSYKSSGSASNCPCLLYYDRGFEAGTKDRLARLSNHSRKG